MPAPRQARGQTIAVSCDIEGLLILSSEKWNEVEGAPGRAIAAADAVGRRIPQGAYWSMLDMPGDIEVEALEENAERAATLLRSIGSKWRLLVLCQLVKGEKSVGELERIIGLSQSALSQHLMVLRRSKLVKTRRAAQMIFYSLDGPEVTAILTTLYGLYCEPDGEAGGSGRKKK